MLRVAGRFCFVLACLALSLVTATVITPATAGAEDTVWICKPGQSDDLCAGTIDGATLPPPGKSAQPLGYTRPQEAPVDCFYLYPTQSSQPTPNSNLDKDPPIRRVVVLQARMFSSVCDVYAPMYRQVTYSGNQVIPNPDVEVAYQSAKAAFEDFLQNYNGDRGFVMLGHSQGSAHTARLIAELVDPDPELRERFVGAFAPGANISVPIDQPVGGLFDRVPACTEVGQYGCMTAFSMFNDVPGPAAIFSRLDFGYWIYPDPRPDPSRFEVMCTNPALLDGGDGTLDPLVDTDYLTGVPASESPAPWVGFPEYYRVECKRQGGAHWLNVSKVGLPGDTRPDLGAAIASGSNYHVPEFNLAEGNFLRIAQLQIDGYEAEQARVAKLRAKLKQLNKRLTKAKKRQAVAKKKVRKVSRKLKRADAGSRRTLKKKLKAGRRQVAGERRRVRSLKKQITRVKRAL